MADPWHIRVYEKQQLVFSADFDGAVELGRQGEGTERLFARKYDEKDRRWRLVIAGRDEDSVSRKHALLEPLPGGKARLTNLSAKVPIRLPDGGDVAPSRATEVTLPTFLLLGRKTVRVQEGAAEPEVEGLREQTLPPGVSGSAPSAFPTIALPSNMRGDEVESLIRWLRGTMDVFQSAANSSEFFHKAAQAVVDNVGLDSGRVLLLEDGDWKTKAVKAAPGVTVEENWQPSQHVLSKVRNERRTFWQSPQQPTSTDAASLVGITSVVAAPILDRQGEVIGALYGDRRQARGAHLPARTTKVDAMLIELLASGVAAGLARLEQEKAAVQAKVQFEQFFTPELAHVLASNPEMLKGQDAEITVLFCDIRGFSRISERLGPDGVVKWIGNVMGALSDCVRQHSGVLVDYIGDELMAMWGAPVEQPDHAALACRAALDMLAKLPELNEMWLPTLGEQMSLGIGINTGVARVGNTGSHHKFKYGPLGNAVNLASRIQGATKYIKTRLLVTEATRSRLGPEVLSRRIGQVKVVNIAEPVELYELMPAPGPGEQERAERMCRDYEAALTAFECCEHREALRVIASLYREHPDDGPSLILLSRVTRALVEPDKCDTVYVLPDK
jgi:adenylate cyclase